MPLLPLASSVTGRQLEPSDVEAEGFAAAVKNQPDGDALLTDRGGEIGSSETRQGLSINTYITERFR
jgi:hypothetical protein